MKQSKDSESPVLSALEPAASRYRHEAPARVSLKLAELEWAIPAAARSANFRGQQEIDLPCAEIFASAVPKITCARLAELHPKYFLAAQLPVAEILLPAAPLALSYRLLEIRDGSDKSSAPAPAEKTAPEPPAEPALSPSKFWPPKPQPAQAKNPEPATPAKSKEPPAAPAPAAKEESKPAVPVDSATPKPLPSAADTPTSPETAPAEASRPFSFFGLFRRKKSAPSTPEIPTTQPASAAPEPKPADSKLSASAAPSPAPKDPSETKTDSTKTPGPDGKKAATADKKEAAPVELVPVSNETSDVLGNQEGLQKVFLTKDKLNLKQVVTLCGGLSGVKSCLLAQGSVIIGAHQPPANLDLVSLSANALQMLDDLRRSASKMGLGAIPAVTIHSEKGPVTFFPSQDLCLLILQDEKGLAPGVREKLEAAMTALGQAGLPRQIGRR